jgi:hypothetical protein
MAAHFRAIRHCHAPTEAENAASPDDFSIEDGLFGLAYWSVGASRDWSASAPFGERCQAIVFLRHLEQASLVLDSVRG